MSVEYMARFLMVGKNAKPSVNLTALYCPCERLNISPKTIWCTDTPRVSGHTGALQHEFGL